MDNQHAQHRRGGRGCTVCNNAFRERAQRGIDGVTKQLADPNLTPKKREQLELKLWGYKLQRAQATK